MDQERCGNVLPTHQQEKGAVDYDVFIKSLDQKVTALKQAIERYEESYEEKNKPNPDAVVIAVSAGVIGLMIGGVVVCGIMCRFLPKINF
jgi:hypothetical protein